MDGKTITATKAERLDPRRHVYKAFKVLHDHNVIHGDSELHNIFSVGTAVMLVNLECARFGEDNEP